LVFWSRGREGDAATRSASGRRSNWRVSHERQARSDQAAAFRPRRWKRRRLARGNARRTLTQRLAVMAIEVGKLEQELEPPRACPPSLSTGPATSWSSCPRMCMPCLASCIPRILDDLGPGGCAALRVAFSSSSARGLPSVTQTDKRTSRPAQGHPPWACNRIAQVSVAKTWPVTPGTSRVEGHFNRTRGGSSADGHGRR